MNIDFKKFKKVDSDDKHTVLMHPSGHTVKIAHKGLSKEHQKELEELPVHMAKGGRAKYAQMYDPNMPKKGANASKPSKSTNTMPGSPTMAKDNFTEPDSMGTSIPKGMLQQDLNDKHYPDVVMGALNREAPPMGAMSAEPKQHMPPCINPSCKSFGKSHPNCRCYGGLSEHSGVGKEGFFAEGGEVDNFCSKDRPHQKDCEYYAHGDLVEKGLPDKKMDKMPISEEVPESEVSSQEPSAPSAPMASQNVNPNPETGTPVDMASPIGQKLSSAVQDASTSKDPSEGNPYSQVPQDVNSANYANALMTDEHNKFIQDVDAGHIEPKKMSDLFADKSLPGKIGTIFGLMLSGAGSGLAHQDNALLGMMNKEIERDLQAQEQNAKNKQNFLSINGANLSNLANSGKIGADTRSLNIAMAKGKMDYALFNELANQASKLPPGSPMQIAAQQKLMFLGDALQKGNASARAMAAQAYAKSQALRGGDTTMMKSGLMGPEMQEYGQDVESKKIPGIQGLASRPIPEHHRDQVQAMNVLDNKAKDLINYSKQHEGTWNPKTRAVAAQKADEMVSYYNSSVQGGVLTEGRLKWLDDQIKKNPTSVIAQELYGNNARLQEIQSSNNMRKDMLLKSLGFNPKQENKTSKPSTIIQNGHTYILNQKTGKYE